MAKGNWYHNYPRVMAYLKKKGYEYAEFAGGQHLKVFGPAAVIDLWPSRMTYHIIMGENAAPANEWPRLDYKFKAEELEAVLQGDRI